MQCLCPMNHGVMVYRSFERQDVGVPFYFFLHLYLFVQNSPIRMRMMTIRHGQVARWLMRSLTSARFKGLSCSSA